MYKSLNNNSIKTLEPPFSIGLIAHEGSAVNAKSKIIFGNQEKVIVYTNNCIRLTIKAATSTSSGSSSGCINIKAITKNYETVDLENVPLNETKTFMVSDYFFVGFSITGSNGKNTEVTVE